MSMDFSTKLVTDRVEKIWEKVFKDSNEVLRQADVYGFFCMQAAPNPNIHAMLVQLQVFSAVMDIIIAQGPKNGLKYEHTRLILNAKEQVTRMERVATALHAENEDDFYKAIIELERQSVF